MKLLAKYSNSQIGAKLKIALLWAFIIFSYLIASSMDYQEHIAGRFH